MTFPRSVAVPRLKGSVCPIYQLLEKEDKVSQGLYLFTQLLRNEYDVTQGQFLSGVQLWIHCLSYPIPVAEGPVCPTVYPQQERKKCVHAFRKGISAKWNANSLILNRVQWVNFFFSSCPWRRSCANKDDLSTGGGGGGEKWLVYAFPMDISVKWNANSRVRDSNLVSYSDNRCTKGASL